MYFHYESGYDASDLVVQLRQEKKVAKEIGLSERNNFLGLMENLVCHFHGIQKVESTIPRARMSSEVIKMRMSNEAHKVLSYLNDPVRQNLTEKKNGEAVSLRRKVYKYPYSICKKEYNNLANHMRHAHKLSKREIEELKKEKNQERAKGNKEKNTNKRPIRCCPLKGCTWVGRRYDYHLPKFHAIKKGSKKYLSLINKRT